MRSTKKIIMTLLAMFFVSVNAHAGAKVVIDPWAIGAFTANGAAVKLVEDEHNQELDSISDKQKNIAKYTATMESIKELYRMSMQNVSGFGEESVYYKEMVQEFIKIPGNVANALKAMKGCPIVNYINSLDEISNIQLQVVDIIQTFADVVNNGKVDVSDFTSKKGDKLSQLLQNAKIGKKKDGYNFLDRYERLGLCCTLIGQISDINMRLEQITYICTYCKSLSNLLYSIDPDTWVDMMAGANIVDNIINDWKWEMEGKV